MIRKGFESKPILCLFEQCVHKPDVEYWLNLGQSSEFEGQFLIERIHCIYEDILKVWNFDDPTEVSCRVSF